MENRNLITVSSFCTYHGLEISFISKVQEEGLLEISYIEGDTYLPEDILHKLEQIVRLYKELNINPEGIGAIFHLLEKIEHLQEENEKLKTRLRKYEI
ncbi:chaperone modulator CbpM [Litoribacter alkaliphilus]|uniref:Chaperone modulator CbpM n=1 Tax=Litoribacter ruber TaxID=702568 RepID=A0AAP2CH14_9BACT|nr:chaperone modulator CbpM [Litoribacter alkaliphilus]MBS9524536.1 chaperone modulator CbpM [Litoribacter alkaliphilus]